jgi:NADH-quinone oxidoreductase subunit L
VGWQEYAAIFLVFAPGLAAVIAGLGQRALGDRGSMAVTVTLVVAAFGAAAALFLGHAFAPHEAAEAAHGAAEHGAAAATDAFKHDIILLRWIDIGTFKADWAIRMDALSVTMMFVVTSVSALVHIYSISYMSHDPHRARFFAYLSLFTFAMLMLVTANNFIQLFFGWEGVGLASYLLIGFWYRKPSANSAAIKAFVVNRVGDFGFALGIMALVFMIQAPAQFIGADGQVAASYLHELGVTRFSSVEFDTVFAVIQHNALVQPIGASVPVIIGEMKFEFLGQWVWGLEVAGVLLFIGAMGKSAQFILHTWLPDAMEGPTPVSALIHAATMVTAGVFLVCRCSYLYEHTLVAANMITVIGAITCFFAATVGMAQNDIKRVVAYSTCSQLGYMFFAAGIGAYQAAMFHLFTHAFFKALLFLSAGAVIHGLHDEQDMRNMGGLRKYMPVTWGAMLIGTLALTGVGIPGTEIGFAGFFSKDAIIESAYASHDTFAQFAFWLSVIAACLTSFYSWRLMFMTFEGKPRWAGRSHDSHGHDAHGHDHGHAAAAHGHDAKKDAHGAHGDHSHDPHDAPPIMIFVLGALALGAVIAGFVFHNQFIDEGQVQYWGSAIFNGPQNHILHARHEVPEWVKWSATTAWIVGLAFAILFYLVIPRVPRKIAASGGPLHAFLSHKWYFDELYNFVFVKGAALVGDIFWKVGDKKIIDGLGPDGVTAVAKGGAGGLSRLHTGLLFHYAFVILVSAVVFGAAAIFGGRG